MLSEILAPVNLMNILIMIEEGMEEGKDFGGSKMVLTCKVENYSQETWKQEGSEEKEKRND